MEQLEGCYGCWSLARRITEADATIAALQARVQVLEAEVDTLTQQEESWESQLTQRTAELERVKGQFADLRKMVAALPKVEGEIRLIHADDGDWHVVDLYDAIFTDKSWAVSYAALLQHRQGMEG